MTLILKRVIAPLANPVTIVFLLVVWALIHKRRRGVLLGELAELTGIAPTRLIPVTGARDTREEALLMRPLLGTNAFYLVTSDIHMPRAMLGFQKAGMQPVPAPAGGCGRGDPLRLGLEHLYPRSHNLCATDRALHEYLGIVWARLTGPEPQP